MMRWLFKPRFTWADFFFLLAFSQIEANFWIYLVYSIIWFAISSFFTNKTYHEPLPREN